MTVVRCYLGPLNLTSLCAGMLLALAGCASTQLDAQWADPQLTAGNPLRGARLLVVCEAQDLVLRRICQDQVGAQVLAAGATPVAAPDIGGDAPNAPSAPAQYLAAAKAASAKAVLVTAISQGSTVAQPGFSVGFGLGGFGGGRVGGGVGVSAPIGGTKVATGYAANSSITDAASGRLVWTARASEPPSDDVNAQVSALAKAVVSAAGTAGLF